MPTGYTAELSEKGQSFNDFVLQCARAFGACIHQRDEPFGNKPKPEKTVSQYNVERLNDTINELNVAKLWTVEEQLAYGISYQETEIKTYKQYIARAKEKKQRYMDMIEKVTAWVPPTSDHNGLKEFMLEQLNSGMDGDCDYSYYERELASVQNTNPRQFYTSYIAGLERNVDYHQKEMAKEQARVTGRSDWIIKLYESLGEEVPT